MIRLESVSKYYGGLCALDHFTAAIRAGSLVGLLGPNGAGKTTLMNILTGSLAASGGTVLIGGHDILFEASRAKRMIGWLPEHVPLYPEMTVHSFLRFVCDLKQVLASDRERHIMDIASLTGIREILPRVIAHLSKGYRQRVGLAQALCGDPEILILDEPTAGLDPLQAAEFRQLLKALHRDHTILLSSHILADMENVCERVLIIRDGKLQKDVDLTGENESEIRLSVRIAMGRDSLISLLRTVPEIRSIEPVRSEEAGITDLIMTAPKDFPIERTVFSLMAKHGAPILRMTRQHSTLEDVFLSTMRE